MRILGYFLQSPLPMKKRLYNLKSEGSLFDWGDELTVVFVTKRCFITELSK